MSDLLSFPRDRIKVLLLEGIHDTAVERLQALGYTQVTRLNTALEGPALHTALAGVHMLGIRSRTQLTAEVLAAAERLLCVGCFCIGTNQVDLEASRRRGIAVFNAPFSNTRSVAELVMGEIVMLLRGIVGKSNQAHKGGWDKSAANSWEVRGKTLGIVGYGNIGSQLSVLAEAFGMRVLSYDISDRLGHGNVVAAASLEALLAECDVISLHVPETPATEGMFGTEQISAMKPGSFLINNARGNVVDLDALADALRRRHLLGAAIDVFPVEPRMNAERFTSPLQGLDNVILTPHIGGSTAEAQARIGIEVARKLAEYSDTGTTTGAVNFPQVQLPRSPRGTRFMHVHRNAPGVLRRINDIFADAGANIAAQHLQTQGDLGYVVVEAELPREADRQVLEAIRGLDGTIRARLLYRED